MPTPTSRRLTTAILDPRTEWTRRRLQVLFIAILAVALAMLAGGVWSLVSLLNGGSTADPKVAGVAESPQDQMAGKPLPHAPLEAAQPGDLSPDETGTLAIPAPMDVGRAGVATGYPQTAEGALSQLAAIDTTALTSASVRVAQRVITQWAAPDGPTSTTWSTVKGLASLLGSAGMSADGKGSITIGVEPAMGLIKGTVGDAFVIPCVDFIVTATVATGPPQRVAVADCQRMVWQDHRWVIGPGEEPTAAPSLWPGTQDSYDAGYQWLQVPQ